MPSEARLNIFLRAMLLSEAMVNIFFIHNMSRQLFIKRKCIVWK